MKIILTFQGGEQVAIDRDGTLHSNSEPARRLVEFYMRLVPESTNLPHPWEPMADTLVRELEGVSKEILAAPEPGEPPVPAHLLNVIY